LFLYHIFAISGLVRGYIGVVTVCVDYNQQELSSHEFGKTSFACLGRFFFTSALKQDILFYKHKG